MAQTMTPFLLFDGAATEAISFYVDLFGGTVLALSHYGPDGPGAEGTVARAVFEVAGQQIMCTDSVTRHEFGFTPAVSLFVDCGDEAEIDRLWAALAAGGEALMPLGDYGFSRRFGWTNDRFGVSWQLNLA